MTRSVFFLRLSAATIAAICVWIAATRPLWTLTMRAPQYPQGLSLEVFGTHVAGDIAELGILNHYIGMPPIEAPAFETMLFPYGIWALLALCAISVAGGWFRRAARVGLAIAPLAVLVDLQWRLYVFGHSLDPKAPIRLAPFTPLVIGQTSMGNFVTTGMVASGFWLLLAAAVAVSVSNRRFARGASAAAAATAAMLAMWSAGIGASHPPIPAEHERLLAGLQQTIDAAAPGAIVRVAAGVYRGPIRLRGPLTVIGEESAVIDGGGVGSVVIISGDGVTFEGFHVRNSGREVTEEAAGISATGNGHRITRNRIDDVYFGIHLDAGRDLIVSNNDIAPGERRGARPGHGISAWNVRDSRIEGNRITAARDGVYFSFTERLTVAGNVVEGCRYGLHSMYSADAAVTGNRLTANLLGAALMMSARMSLTNNTIERHREGAAAYGVLLKDISEFEASGNRITGNRIGLYAEGVAADSSGHARLTDNIIAGNDVGMALQSTAAMVASGNDFSDNLTDVRPLGRRLSDRMQWSAGGRGNHWSLYRGYDAGRDGIGDQPYQLDDAMDALLQRNDSIRALLYTPAHRAVDAAARMFPLLRQPPVLIDAHPLMSAASRSKRR